MTARDRFAGAAREALGGGRRLVSAERLSGGSRKGVHRLTADDGSTAIGYIWGRSETFWPVSPYDGDLTDTFTAADSADAFAVAHTRLTALGVRTPAIRLLDAAAGLAIVEDIRGDDLEHLLERDPQAAAPVLAKLADMLAVMRDHHGPAFGKVALVDTGGTARGATCADAALIFALRCLDETAAQDHRLRQAHDRLTLRLRTLADALRPRTEYSVVHNELWGHVLVDHAGEPALIDIEDLMYFDVEWEHVYLRITMYGDYEHLRVPDLDEDRIALYTLVQRLSLAAGTTRLMNSDYPDRAFMKQSAEWNTRQAIGLGTPPDFTGPTSM